jgi:hypothetical protein
VGGQRREEVSVREGGGGGRTSPLAAAAVILLRVGGNVGILELAKLDPVQPLLEPQRQHKLNNRETQVAMTNPRGQSE